MASDVADSVAADSEDSHSPDAAFQETWPADEAGTNIGDVADTKTSDTFDVGGMPADCTGTAVYPPEGTTLLLDVGPLVSNPVFTCGSAPPPQPVAVGCSTCDCPLPYSCYCNGECAWLRTPDLKKPHFNSKAVWTGKWVVSVTYDHVINSPASKWDHSYFFRAERWDPKSGKGFEKIPLGVQEAHYSEFEVAAAAGKVVIASTDNWVRVLYDPVSNTASQWKTGNVGWGRIASTGNLVARLEAKIAEPGFPPAGRLQLIDPVKETYVDAQFPTAFVPADGYIDSLRILANTNAVFAYDSVNGQKPFPDGTFAKDVGHVLKYDLATGTWSDVGTVPKKWSSGHVHSAVVDDSGAILIVRDPGDSVARLANGVLTEAPVPASFDVGNAERSAGHRVPCGMVLAYPAWWAGSDVSTSLARATVIRDDLTLAVLPIWGWPDDQDYGPGGGSSVLTDQDFVTLGGLDSYFAHRDGYRYPLSRICK
ncbi:MAG: hypothetical protein HY902_12895 [Deltaproteobacteria bacterium]|nr:hypothetical protein [Deltaproteobacteria bacterium]